MEGRSWIASWCRLRSELFWQNVPNVEYNTMTVEQVSLREVRDDVHHTQEGATAGASGTSTQAIT